MGSLKALRPLPLPAKHFHSVVVLFFITITALFLPVVIQAQGPPDNVWSKDNPAGATSVAYAPDGQTVFSGHMENNGQAAANLWRMSDGTLLFSVSIHELGCGTINHVAYSPNSEIVAAITGCTTRLYRVSDGSFIRTIHSGGGANAFHDPSALAFSPDGLLLATTFSSGYRLGSVNLWSTADGTKIRTMNAGGYNAVRFSNDGQIVAAVGQRGLDLWRVVDGTLIRHIDGPKRALAFSPDGLSIVTAGLGGGEFSEDDTIEFYRLADGVLTRKLIRTGRVMALAFLPDGQALISSGYESNAEVNRTSPWSNGTIRFWRISDGALLQTYDQRTSTTVSDIAISPEGRLYAYAAGLTVNVAQVPDISTSACRFSISPLNAVIPCEGATGTIAVTAAQSCSWKATSRVNWITIMSGASGSGNGTVTYTIPSTGCSAVPGSELTNEALLIVAEQTFVVNQKLAPPNPTPTPTPLATPTPTPMATPTPTPTATPTPSPTPTPTPGPPPPVLLTEPDSAKAVALESTLWVRDPFSVFTTSGLSKDHRSRLMLFATNVDLQPGETLSAVSAEAEDAAHNKFPVVVEYLGPVPEFGWLSQLVIKMPDELAGAGDVWVSLKLHGLSSNKVMITIGP